MKRKARFYSLLSFAVFCLTVLNAAAAFAKTIEGVVLGTSNEPLSGASVIIRGTTIGTSTDVAGKFTINVPSDSAVLVVSYTGYVAQEVTIGNQTTLTIHLAAESKSLNEIVVTGYTAQRKKDIIGAVSVVNTEDLKTTPSSDVGTQLQGRASGVTVSSTGAPGSAANVRIRGFASYGNNNPLYVIDGVPTTDASRLNPQDIESMQVLKDASSASIYGSRAANGVIIITTKHGKANKTSVSYDNYVGYQMIPYNRIPEMLNTKEVMEYLNKTTAPGYTDPIYGANGSFSIPDMYVVSNGFKGGVAANDPRVNPDLYTIADYSNIYQIFKTSPGTDWFRAMSQKGIIQSHQLSASGGTDRSTYSMGINYFDQDGVFKYTGYKRYSVRMNSSFKATSFLTIGENMQIAYDNYTGDPTIIGEQSAWANAFRGSPFIPVYDINGGWGGSLIGGTSGVGSNPVAYLYRRKDWTNKTLRAFGNIYADITFTKGLVFHTSFGADAAYGMFRQALLQEYERAERRTVTQLTEGSNSFVNTTWTNTLNFQKTFGLHDLKVLLGMEQIKNTTRGLSAFKTRYDFEADNFLSLNTGLPAALSDIGATNPVAFTTTLLSYFTRLDYTYAGKYLVNATFRRDGSSVFGPSVRYGNFPSFGLGWRLSEEKFMKGIDWLGDLKLRGGWGQMGSISNVPANNQYIFYSSTPGANFYDINAANNTTTQGYGTSAQGNPNTKWETSTTTNLGVDASMLRGKWSISIDVYKKDTKDLLVPSFRNGLEALVTKPLINLGTMRNTGIDIQLANNGKIAKDLSYDVSVAFTHYKNELTKLNNENTPLYVGLNGRLQNVLVTTKGEPISSFYGYQTDGFYNNAEEVAKGPTINGAPGVVGSWKFKDVDGDGNITTADRVILGSPHPDFQMGFNLGLNYKNFDFTGFLFWNHGNKIFNFTKFYTYMGALGGGIAKGKLYYAWTPETAGSAKTPVLAPGTASGYTSFVTGNPLSFYVENGTYLRMKTLQLGYTFPKAWLSKAKITTLRIYLQAQNLFTVTKYTGADPDLGVISAGQAPGGTPSDQTLGVDISGFPTPRQYLAGINLSF
jgi:TonB-linked SusC/RagA family outer membrane protein